MEATKFIKIREPTLELNFPSDYVMMEGGKDILYDYVESTSYSTSQISANVQVPQPDTVLDREIMVYVPVTLEFSGIAPLNQNLLQTGHDAPRAFPISSNMSIMQCKINSTTAMIESRRVVQPLLRYNTGLNTRMMAYGTAPSMLDNTQEYSSMNGAVKNPLGGYHDGFEAGRGAHMIHVITNDVGDGVSTVTAKIEMIIAEKLFLSPFAFGHNPTKGFYGVNSLSFNFTWDSANTNLARLWSHSNGSGVTGFAVTAATIGTTVLAVARPAILLKYITPQEGQIIPRQLSYPYFVTEHYSVQGTVKATGQLTGILTIPSIKVGSIPHRAFIYCNRTEGTQTVETTDTFLSLESLDVKWNTKAGLFASARKEQLYDICRRRGCNMTWNEWSGGPAPLLLGAVDGSYGTTGSVMCLEFGRDIPLKEHESAGMVGTNTLVVKANFKNISAGNYVPEMHVVLVYGGLLNIQDLKSTEDLNPVDPPKMAITPYSEFPYAMYSDAYGGNFWTGIKNFGKRIWSGLKSTVTKIPDIIKAVGPTVKELAPIVARAAPKILPLLGLGEDGLYRDKGGNIVGRGVIVGGKRKKKMKGGRFMSIEELKRGNI